ncbi:MAG: hypothetical protein RB292_04030 [Patescibacteria group bacterium]|jgi:hypothetical protein|nr:hypothetical protein [Patescibacteria group bacterium]
MSNQRLTPEELEDRYHKTNQHRGKKMKISGKNVIKLRDIISQKSHSQTKAS